MDLTTSHLGFRPDVAPAAAAAHFAARLAYETDVSDVHAAAAAGERFTLVDVRSAEAWAAGHVPGAVHLPGGKVRLRAAGRIDPALPVVTYCWGPACNGATHGAFAFAALGYHVKEMLGGYEYWVREGFPVETGDGSTRRHAVDPLTAVP